MEHHFPIEIYNERDLLEKIKGEREFRPRFPSTVYVRKGSMSTLINGERNEYAANQVLFISDRNIYEMDYISDDIELYVIHNNQAFSRPLDLNFNKFEIYKLITVEQNNPMALPEEEFDFIWSLLQGMYRQIKDETHSPYKIDIIFHLQGALIYAVVGHLEASTRSRFFVQNNRKARITISFMELVFQNFIQQKELKFYADELNISVKYLSICVKDTTGNPPTYFLVQLLLDEAKVRLTVEMDQISDIAYSLNFADPYSFSKFFRHNMGISPTEYRKRTTELHTI